MKTTFGLPKKREQVINMLQQAYIDQNLEDDEYENRLKQAMDANSVEDLQLVIHDFPNNPQLLESKRPKIGQNSGTTTTFGGSRGEALQQKIVHAFSRGDNTRSVAVLGSKTLDIAQEINSPLRASTYFGEHRINLQNASVKGDSLVISLETGFGSTVIDLRGIAFAHKHIQLDLMVIFGEVSILLPKGAQVNNKITPMLGEVNHKYQKVKKWIQKLIGSPKAIEKKPIPYTITLYGTCVLGEVALVHD